MECVDKLLDVRIFITYVDQMENNHQNDTHTFQVVYVSESGFEGHIFEIRSFLAQG